nr:uncharacterized protein LOC108070964 isoform X5 [Drosophila kikkawai]
MSFLGNTSDLECEKNEFPRPRATGIVTKVAAHKLSSEPKWADKREDDSDSEVSSPDNFLTKGAFLLTPSYELSMERAALICEKMSFKGCFSLTKTATGILFKFSHPDDYQAVFKKGFHKVTGARFYRKQTFSRSAPPRAWAPWWAMPSRRPSVRSAGNCHRPLSGLHWPPWTSTMCCSRTDSTSTMPRSFPLTPTSR